MGIGYPTPTHESTRHFKDLRAVRGCNRAGALHAPMCVTVGQKPAPV